MEVGEGLARYISLNMQNICYSYFTLKRNADDLDGRRDVSVCKLNCNTEGIYPE